MTKEDLQQIAELLKPIHEQLGELNNEVAALRTGQAAMTIRLDRIEVGQEELRSDTRHTRMLIESQEHNIRLIAEQYTDIAEKLDKANDRAAQLDDMRERVRTLETVVMNHTAALKELRRAE